MSGNEANAAVSAWSVFSADSQDNRLLRLEFPREDGPNAILLPNRLLAREEISRCFRFEIELLSDDASIPLKALMGAAFKRSQSESNSVKP
ncbi:phage late control D family protein [Massilia sp. TS11]|uniref:phage late control D family protein n=1 Tax=Massilia sp. TS11 TaxID=2908003 RepID=UPI001EDAD26B|nr:phage late control D family protein [Massilia sp. TS11]MCG2583668.1 phage late control D family protein [Massilia sp. TS11]